MLAGYIDAKYVLEGGSGRMESTLGLVSRWMPESITSTATNAALSASIQVRISFSGFAKDFSRCKAMAPLAAITMLTARMR